MLTGLSIRDIVLIEKLDLALGDGLTVLTGETGAGKSILLDSLGLALGERGDPGLVRASAAKGVVTAAFALAPGHPARALIDEQGLDVEGDLVLRRVQSADGGSRAFVNDQPVGVGLLRQIGATLVEIHGQHDSRALIEAANHRALLDAFGGLEAQGRAVRRAHEAFQTAEAALRAHRDDIARAEAERAYTEHAAAELRALKPEPGEEQALADRRQLMMNAEQFASALKEARDAIADDGTLAARIAAVLRRLERKRDQAGGLLDEPCAALDRLASELAEAERALSEATRAFAFDQRELEAAEERLFALRALARKHKVQVDDLAGLLERFEGQLASLDEGERRLAALETERAAARERLDLAADELSRARQAAAKRLDKAVMAELAPLKLEKARFETRIDSEPSQPSATGIDRVEFLVAANPGTPLSPLAKAASGGELSRFMLALKVVLAAKGSAPTLIFDEIDTGMGGAVADAIGQRLARLAQALQVVAVTHSPQVASRAGSHYLIAKRDHGAKGAPRVMTSVAALDGEARREEIARMLSGAEVTAEARAQAERLMAAG
jgi:DNA repair protein RecN (Recombination protein N)